MNRLFSPSVRKLFFASFLTLWVWGCESTLSPETIPSGILFQTLEKGRFSIWDVQRITYSELLSNDTARFELMEVVTDSFVDLAGNTAWRLERFIRPAGSRAAWQFDSLWVARREEARLVRVENNQPVIALVFPVRQGKSWDANALNTLNAETRQYARPGERFEVNGQVYNGTVRVNGRQEANLLSRTDRWEVYAEGAGLIYRYRQEVLYINDFTNPFYGTDSIIGGFFIEQKLLQTGVAP